MLQSVGKSSRSIVPAIDVKVDQENMVSLNQIQESKISSDEDNEEHTLEAEDLVNAKQFNLRQTLNKQSTLLMPQQLLHTEKSEVRGKAISMTNKQDFMFKSGIGWQTTILGGGSQTLEREQKHDKNSNNNNNNNNNNNKNNRNFGFIKAEKLYGSGQGDGLFDSQLYISSLQSHVKNEDLKRGNISIYDSKQPRSKSVLERMEEYVTSSSETKKRFMESMMTNTSTLVHKKYLKHENDGQNFLNKINQHLIQVKCRQQYDALANASYMKKGMQKQDGESDADIDDMNNNKPGGNNLKDDKLAEKKGTIVLKKRSQEVEISELPYINAQTDKRGGNSNKSKERQMYDKNIRIMKGKYQEIVKTHQKAIKDIDFAFSDVTEEAKKQEILKRIQKLTDQIQQQNDGELPSQQQQPQQQQQQYQHHSSQQINQININHDKSSSIIGGQSISSQGQKNQYQKNQQQNMNNSQALLMSTSNFPADGTQYDKKWLPDINIAPSTLEKHESLIAITQQFAQQQQQQQQQQTQESENSIKPTKQEKLELQKQALAQNEERVEDENRIYYQQGFLQRKKELMANMSHSNNKEQALDRVLMSYFHQQDLLEISRKKVKSSTKNQNQEELGKILQQFNPQHMRLQMTDLQRTKHNRARSVQKNVTSLYSQQPSRNSNNNKNLNKTEIRFEGEDYDDVNIDGSIYREEFKWKKQQNQTVNYAKVCLPSQMVLKFMHQDPKFKKQQDIEVIDFLMALDPAKQSSEGEEKIGITSEEQDGLAQRQKDAILRRCFFKYSNKNDAVTSERYQEVNINGFVQLFQNLSGKNEDFKIPSTGDSNNNTKKQQQFDQKDNGKNNKVSIFSKVLAKIDDADMKQSQIILTIGNNSLSLENIQIIFNKATKKKSKPVLNYYEFLQALEKVSIQVYLKNIRGDDISQPQELFERFYKEVILPQHLIFRDPAEIQLIKMREIKQIDNLINVFEQGIKDLFILAGSLRSQRSYSVNQIYLGFQELFEIIEKLGFFPTKISKITIRYFYAYSTSFDQGLDFKDFCLCFHLLGLHIVRFPLKHSQTKSEPDVSFLQKQCRQIQYALFKLKQENALTAEVRKFIKDISVFYVHAEFIDFTNIDSRILRIKDSAFKQLQQAV